MRKRYALLYVVIGTFLYLPLVLLSTSTISAQLVTISIDAPTEIQTDTTFIAKVNISNVTNFDACNYDVVYDPSILEIVDISNGMIDENIIPVDIWGELAPGRARVIENIPGIPGVSGSGYLAEIKFLVVGECLDTPEITITNETISDINATEIQVALQDI